MKTKETIKRGDKVYAYTSDERQQNYEATVKSAGRKFIIIDGVGSWMNKFSREDLRCEQWGCYRLFLGTKEEYENYQKTMAERDNLINEVVHLTKNFNLEQLRDLREYINGMNQ